MHILYIHQHFKTPEEGGAIRSYYIAKGLADAGYSVTLLTAHNEPGYRKIFIDGIHVHYLPVKYKQTAGFPARLWAFFKFVVLACYKACSFKKVDLCYASSTPLTVGLITLYLKRRFNIPFYFEVRDLWPEAPIQMKVIKNHFLKQFLYWLEKKIYQKAQLLIALSPGIEQYIHKIVPGKPVLLLPNLSDCQFFGKTDKNLYHEEQFDAVDKFVVSYFGAIGRSNQLESMISAAEACLHSLPEVVFFIAGDGSELPRLQQQVTKKQLSNVRFVPFQNKYGLLSLLNITDAAYIGFADNPVLQSSSPNKFFDALAAGKLCITITEGWLTDLVEENKCGIYVNPEQPDAFITALAPFVHDRQMLDVYQTNARQLAERQFDRHKMVENLLAVISSNMETKKSTACTLTA